VGRRLGDPGAAGDPADGPPSTVPVQPSPIRGQEDRALGAGKTATSITPGHHPASHERSRRSTTAPERRLGAAESWARPMGCRAQIFWFC